MLHINLNREQQGYEQQKSDEHAVTAFVKRFMQPGILSVNEYCGNDESYEEYARENQLAL